VRIVVLSRTPQFFSGLPITLLDEMKRDPSKLNLLPANLENRAPFCVDYLFEASPQKTKPAEKSCKMATKAAITSRNTVTSMESLEDKVDWYDLQIGLALYGHLGEGAFQIAQENFLATIEKHDNNYPWLLGAVTKVSISAKALHNAQAQMVLDVELLSFQLIQNRKTIQEKAWASAVAQNMDDQEFASYYLERVEKWPPKFFTSFQHWYKSSLEQLRAATQMHRENLRNLKSFLETRDSRGFQILSYLEPDFSFI
jgi:hypothetical protein